MESVDEQALKAVADLMVQAMMFDMQVDWETGTLIPKSTFVAPFWLTNWKDKTLNADRQPEDYEGGKDDR